LILGLAVSGAGWLQLAWAPAGAWGVVSFVLMLFCFGAGVVLIFSNLLALRQAITPPAMLARMTSTMRWITLFPALPGPLLGGWLGERMGTDFTLAFGGAGALVVALAAWRFTAIPAARHLPEALADDLENGEGKPL
jgi:MFS family permease